VCRRFRDAIATALLHRTSEWIAVLDDSGREDEGLGWALPVFEAVGTGPARMKNIPRPSTVNSWLEWRTAMVGTPSLYCFSLRQMAYNQLRHRSRRSQTNLRRASNMKKSNKAAHRTISQTRQVTRSLPHSALSAVTGSAGDDPPPTGDDKPPIIK